MKTRNAGQQTARRWGAVLAVVLGGAAHAQTSGSAFLNIPASPRAYSLGQTNVAAVGAQSIGRNPANAGLMNDRFEVFSSYASMMDGARFEHVAAVFAPSRLGGLDAVGFSVTRLQADGFQGADASGNKTGSTLGLADTAIALTASMRLTQGLRAGLTGKMIQSQLAGYSSGASFAGDAGLTYTLSEFSKPLTAALSVTNAGPGTRYLSQTDPLPTSLNMGLAVPFGPAIAIVEVNRMVHDQRTEFGGGLEYALGPVAFRAGYLVQNNGTNLAARDQPGAAGILLTNLSLGLGINLKAISVDYAVSEQAVEYGPTQRLALTIHFGARAAQKPAEQWQNREDRSDWLIVPMGSY